MQQLTLWGEMIPQRQRKQKARPHTLATSYSIIGANDCEIISHTLNDWDLLGCSTCIDCGVRIFCPLCTKMHPQDENAIPVSCPNHEESTVQP